MSAMQFWGVEVKAGEPLKVKTVPPYVIHISQAALEPKKSNEPTLLSVKVNDKRIVLGTLSADKFPQVPFDLVFDEDFELSHTGKGSVHFSGYQTIAMPDEEFDSDDESDSEEEELALANGKVEPKMEVVKSATAKATAGKAEASKPKDKPTKPSNDESDEDDSEEDDDSDEDLLEGDSSDDMEGMSEDDEDEDDDEDESEDEETPKKVESKKRPNESATKTPVPSKKAKSETPQKSDKKSGHVSTPHPSKNAGKASANGKQTPKSGGQFSCKSCDKSFGSDGALKSHSQAKHGGK